ncbi:NAD(P)H dehydrogenase [Pasteurellaceae bacterium RH1A]|nr:NAD(P)H dehydrogenase [Pasteurellaceae bacterium RH1A]
MSKILIISAHQNLNQSVSNRLIIKELAEHFGSKAQIRRLSDLYPDYQIDVQAEQKALLDADIVLLQYPTFWYNPPSILQKWLEDILVFGFAYGPDGSQLAGKKLLVSTTTGKPAHFYTGELFGNVEEMVKAVRLSAEFASMDWQGVHALHGVLYVPNMHSADDLANIENQAKAFAKKLISEIEKLAS